MATELRQQDPAHGQESAGVPNVDDPGIPDLHPEVVRVLLGAALGGLQVKALVVRVLSDDVLQFGKCPATARFPYVGKKPVRGSPTGPSRLSRRTRILSLLK